MPTLKLVTSAQRSLRYGVQQFKELIELGSTAREIRKHARLEGGGTPGPGRRVKVGPSSGEQLIALPVG